MAMQYSVAVRDAMNNAVETAIGVSPVLRIRTGAQPANCAAARTGTVLATLTLPSDWLSASSAGVKSLLGTWLDSAADATGTAAHYEIMDSGIATAHEQGSVTLTGGGGDLTLDNTNIAAGQQVQITAYAKTRSNA